MQKPANKTILSGRLCALGCETLFGLSYIFTKQAAGQAGALALLGWRFLIALSVMALCMAAGLISINLKGKPIRPLLVIGLFSPVIYFIGETVGITLTTASESGAFLACIPVGALIASTVILHKKPSRLQTLGILVTLSGVLVTVFAVGAASSLSIPGYLMLLTAVIAYALYSVSVEKAEAYTGAEITFAMLASGAAVFGLLALAEATIKGTLGSLALMPFTSQSFLIAILYQGIGCSVLAFFLSNIAIARIGVNRAASFIGIATVVSIAAGVLLLHERFSTVQAVGALLIIAGVYIANAKG